MATLYSNRDGHRKGSFHPLSRFSYKDEQHNPTFVLLPHTSPQKIEEGLEKKSTKGKEAGRGMEEPVQSVRPLTERGRGYSITLDHSRRVAPETLNPLKAATQHGCRSLGDIPAT